MLLLTLAPDINICIIHFLVLAIIFFLLCWYFACKPRADNGVDLNEAPSIVERTDNVSNGNISRTKENGIENPLGLSEIVEDEEVETKF